MRLNNGFNFFHMLSLLVFCRRSRLAARADARQCTVNERRPRIADMTNRHPPQAGSRQNTSIFILSPPIARLKTTIIATRTQSRHLQRFGPRRLLRAFADQPADLLELLAGQRQFPAVPRQIDCFQRLFLRPGQRPQAVEQLGKLQLREEVRLRPDSRPLPARPCICRHRNSWRTPCPGRSADRPSGASPRRPFRASLMYCQFLLARPYAGPATEPAGSGPARRPAVAAERPAGSTCTAVAIDAYAPTDCVLSSNSG